MIIWAYIFGHPGADPLADRTIIERDGARSILVPVAGEAEAPDVALELIDQEGVEAIELCGGFSAPDAARVIDAVDGRVPVGHVAYALESVEGAAAFKARWSDAG